MKINKIKLVNFQCFKKYETNLANLTFIRGQNGMGKTTLGVDAILFAIFGYSRKNLADVPTRNKAKSCSVEVEVEHGGSVYRIKRSYPTQLQIFKDESLMKFATAMEGQRFLESIFNNLKYFQQFRLFDTSVGINILEEGQQALKKILFAVSDELFNKVREKLGTIKHDREIWCKDKAVVYSHFPSEKRLNLLFEKIEQLSEKMEQADKELRAIDSERIKQERNVSALEEKKRYFQQQIDKTKKQNICYVCNRGLDEKQKQEIIDDLTKKITDLTTDIQKSLPDLKDLKEIIEINQKTKTEIQGKINKVSSLQTKLEGRLKQKDYKYTQADIEVVKTAIKELDNLSTRYLVSSISLLEPIINSVLEKIDFQVKFDVDTKGKFAINLTKDNVIYNYKDLSAGQRLLVQIAFKLALLLEKNEEGLLILDEGLANLDRENLDHVLTLLKAYPFQVIFMLHLFDNIPDDFFIIDLNKEV